MKLPEHLALSYLLAQFGVHQELGPSGTGLMVLAGVLPDLDGLSVLGGWRCHARYHRVLGHGLPITLLGPLALAAAGATLIEGASFWFLWIWLQFSLLVHLLTDVCFYRWPVQLAWPLSTRGPGCGWIGWNDLVPTGVLYAGVLLTLVPRTVPWVAGFSLAALALYVAWRAVYPRGEATWLTGTWAQRAPRLCRWLTGDFVT